MRDILCMYYSRTGATRQAMTEIARLEHICVTDEDVERRYQEMSRQFGVPVEHIRQQLPPMQLSHDLKLAYARAVVVDSGVRL
jgi:FKBP-type peptidyl-prolyl cis-trans isomerase (trigger factor)